ncbi:MAG TPA: hypothetical protein VM165_03675, partial [Planctomycetaceae bacterium]|nr:hypothetical protein [Planctomycetaceae bacterium]
PVPEYKETEPASARDSLARNGCPAATTTGLSTGIGSRRENYDGVKRKTNDSQQPGGQAAQN